MTMRRTKIQERETNFDTDDRIKILYKADGKCAHCGRELYIGSPNGVKEENLFTIDHFIPVNKGGTNQMINLVPLCFPCNKEKDQLILDPGDYLAYLEGKHLKEVTGMYESYIKSFDYLSRNNLLANDVYSFDTPAVTDSRVYRAAGKRAGKLYQHKGTTFHIHRAKLDDRKKFADYYAKYLKKFGLWESDEVTRAHILYWLVNGCIYYIKDKAGEIVAFAGGFCETMCRRRSGHSPGS